MRRRRVNAIAHGVQAAQSLHVRQTLASATLGVGRCTDAPTRQDAASR